MEFALSFYSLLELKLRDIIAVRRAESTMQSWDSPRSETASSVSTATS
jgi:hypothetical protein